MIKWEFNGWESFWDSNDGSPEALLLTTFTLNNDFLVKELLPLIFSIEEEAGELEWYVALQYHLKNIPVEIFVDQAHRIDESRASSTLFEAIGGKLYPVKLEGGIQHAKLWLIKYPKYIRIGIGSCNLTNGGFTRQIQCVWTAELAYDQASGKSRSTDIEFLCDFLRGLPNKTAIGCDDATKSTEQWCEWLKNCSWPEDVALVSVLPNSADEGNQLNKIQNALKRLDLVRKNKFKYQLCCQVFECGNLKKEWLEKFKDSLSASLLTLYWPDKTDIPDIWKKMTISSRTAELLSDAGELRKLSFREDIEKAKERLPHAKLIAGWDPHPSRLRYAFLLMGSSNLSRQAWRNNFELNVIVKNPDGVHFDDETDILEPKDAYINPNPNDWETQNKIIAYAKFDGNDVCAEVSLPRSNATVMLQLLNDASEKIDEAEPKPKNNSIKHRFTNLRGIPHQLYIKADTGEEAVTPVIIPIELDKSGTNSTEDFKRARYYWLLRQYGWNPEDKPSGQFKVLWVERAMSVFKVIDQWDQLETDNKRRLVIVQLLEALDWMAKNESDEDELAFKMAYDELDVRCREEKRNSP